jgi:hypothetical protein
VFKAELPLAGRQYRIATGAGWQIIEAYERQSMTEAEPNSALFVRIYWEELPVAWCTTPTT